MKIFVTGASGFIGGSVAAMLARRGDEVRGLVRVIENKQADRRRQVEVFFVLSVVVDPRNEVVEGDVFIRCNFLSAHSKTHPPG